MPAPALIPAPALAQQAAITGTWEAKTTDGPKTVIIRSDSSASYGNETVRWRLFKDTIALVLGGEWVSYDFKLKGQKMTLSGGDLAEPITLRRVGPPTERPESAQIPPDPDQEPS